MTYETDCGPIIVGNSAPVYFHSSPAGPVATPAAATPAAYPVMAIPAEPQRAPQTRLGGALYFLASGQCPPRAAAPAAYALIPQQSVAAVPMRMAAVAAPAYYYPIASPYPAADLQAPMPPLLASPQDTGRRCRLFGR